MFCRGLLKSSNAWVVLMSAAFLALLTAAGAGRVVVIEDWTTDAVNRRGIPSGWTGEPLDGLPPTTSRSSKTATGGFFTFRVETSIRPSQETSQAK
jgi:hypothetical protein